MQRHHLFGPIFKSNCFKYSDYCRTNIIINKSIVTYKWIIPMTKTILKWINLAWGIIKQTKIFRTAAISFWFASICIISSNFTYEVILSLINFPYSCVIIRFFSKSTSLVSFSVKSLNTHNATDHDKEKHENKGVS